MADLSPKEAWVAGLLEGEGSFCQANKITPRIRITMTDLDVMVKAATILGAHSVLRTKLGIHNRKQPYYLSLHGEVAIKWMEKIYSVMGERRRQQIDVCLKAWEERKTWTGRRKQAPKQGPRLSSPNRVWLNPVSVLPVEVFHR